MDAILILLAVPAAILAAARIGASLWLVVRASRRRAMALEQAMSSPGAPGNPMSIVSRADQDASRGIREDYSLTGAILAGLGAAALFASRSLAYGNLAVGLYAAGILAIVCGFGLALFSAVLRILARPLLEGTDE